MAEKQDSDNILIYMLLMLEKAKEMHLPVRRENFQKYGESVELFKGVKEWFKLINDYGEKHGVIVEHYINSSGMKEIIEGTSIANEFKTILHVHTTMTRMEMLYGRPLPLTIPTRHNTCLRLTKEYSA